MYKTLKVAWCHRLLYSIPLCQIFQTTRHFTARDASVALKPFYFVVHPDLFGQHPAERAVNENSLKLLNEYLAGHASDEKNKNKEIVFYIRSQDNNGQGRTLVFSNSTGVSRLGEIVLSSEDVPQTWVTLLQSVKAYDAVLDRLPKMESKLSSLLNSICVVRRRKQHCHVMAGEYELLLNKLLNSLRRCQDHVTLTFRNRDLSALQLVVEGESSPLMLSSLGQFLIPASVPGTLAVDFIHKNTDDALSILQNITRFLYEEEESKNTAMEVLGLTDLGKDESVTPEQMISCCSRITEQHFGLSVSLKSSRLRVSHYYSIMEDGQICIPWDWVGDDS